MQNNRNTNEEARSTNRNSKLETRNFRILGIDPGYGRLGIAVIESVERRPKLIHSECFETSSKLPHPERLGLIAEKVREIIARFSPQKLAIESLIFSKNEKTALKVAEVRGIILAEAAVNKIIISEHHPNSIKIAVTGYGRSDKKQIIFMIEKILKMDKNSSQSKKKIKYDDEYDAIAVALTCEASRELV
jgi:crossover junction endodeoxyribonuclease RuvC